MAVSISARVLHRSSSPGAFRPLAHFCAGSNAAHEIEMGCRTLAAICVTKCLIRPVLFGVFWRGEKNFVLSRWPLLWCHCKRAPACHLRVGRALRAGSGGLE